MDYDNSICFRNCHYSILSSSNRVRIILPTIHLGIVQPLHLFHSSIRQNVCLFASFSQILRTRAASVFRVVYIPNVQVYDLYATMLCRPFSISTVSVCVCVCGKVKGNFISGYKDMLRQKVNFPISIRTSSSSSSFLLVVSQNLQS